MSYFSPEFIKFFKELSRNNSTSWFQENRKTYEKEVKEPFTKFVDEMIRRIRKFDDAVNIKAGDAIFRINKDIRFSKDKTPYNTHVSANISEFGRKNKAYPGFYFQLSPSGVEIFGGAYMVEKENLEAIRKKIANNLNRFDKVISDKTFIKHFGSLQGEKNQRIAPELKELAARQPLIANKQFYYQAILEPDHILSDKLPELLMEHYRAGKNVNDFLKEAW